MLNMDFTAYNHASPSHDLAQRPNLIFEGRMGDENSFAEEPPNGVFMEFEQVNGEGEDPNDSELYEDTKGEDNYSDDEGNDLEDEHMDDSTVGQSMDI